MKQFFVYIFTQHLAFGLIIPVLVVWQNMQGLSFTEIALIESIGLIFLILAELPSSYLADRYGKKKMIILGMILIAAALYVLTGASNFIEFLAYSILFKIGIATLSGTEESLLHDMIDSGQSTKILGRMSVTDELGTLLGLTLSSLLIPKFSVQYSFYIALLFAVIALISVASMRYQDSFVRHKVENLPPFQGIKANKICILIVMLLITACIAERGDLIFQNQLKTLGIFIGNFGFIYFCGKIFAVLGAHSAHSLEEYFTLKKTVLGGILVQIMAFVLLLTFNFWITVLALSLFFLSENVLRIVLKSFILNNAPSQLRTTFLSLASLGNGLFLIVFTPLIGMLLDYNFGYAVLMIVGLKFLAFWLLIFARKIIPT